MHKIIERIKSGEALSEMNLEMDVEKPWGAYITYGRNIECTAKILIVENDLSIQSHENRDEIWQLVSGAAVVYRGEILGDDKSTIANLKATILQPGDLVFIPKRMVHAVSNLNNEPALVVEVALGHAEESDIHRYYDKHSRVQSDDYPVGLSTAELIEWCRK